jgi:hypothetical protein
MLSKRGCAAYYLFGISGVSGSEAVANEITALRRAELEFQYASGKPKLPLCTDESPGNLATVTLLCWRFAMNPKLSELLNELQSSGERNDAIETDRTKKMLNLERTRHNWYRSLPAQALQQEY